MLFQFLRPREEKIFPLPTLDYTRYSNGSRYLVLNKKKFRITAIENSNVQSQDWTTTLHLRELWWWELWELNLRQSLLWGPRSRIRQVFRRLGIRL